MPRKVLYVTSVLEYGGIQQTLLSLLRNVPRTEVLIDVCCVIQEGGPLESAVRELGIRLLHCPLHPMLIGFLRRFSQLLRECQYDLVHTHLDAHNGPVVWACRRVGVPVVTTFHNTRFPAALWWTKLPVLRHLRAIYSKASVGYAVRYSDVVSACSQASLNYVLGGRQLPPERARILYLGVPTPPPLSQEQRQSLRRALVGSAEHPLVLHVGRFELQKNHFGLLQVFQRVVQRLPQAQLLMAGCGALRASVERHMTGSDLRGSVHLLGPQNDVPRLMQASDVFCLPSFHEGLPIVLMEAYAAGLPVVASRVPGISDAVVDGGTGIMHKVTDVDGMADSVCRIIRNQGLRQSLCEAGRREHAQRYSVDLAVDRVITIYRDCLDLRRRAVTSPEAGERPKRRRRPTCSAGGKSQRG